MLCLAFTGRAPPDEIIGEVIDEFSESEIELAIDSGDLDGLPRALEAGNDANGVDSFGTRYVEVAQQADDGAALRLLGFGADINVLLDNRRTLLHHAASAGNSGRLVATLVDLGANIDAVDTTGYSRFTTPQCMDTVPRQSSGAPLERTEAPRR